MTTQRDKTIEIMARAHSPITFERGPNARRANELTCHTRSYDALQSAGLLAQEWQDISTAPRDGAQFLVTDGSCVVMAEHPDDDLIVHDITSCGLCDVTHWMPLPTPPTKEQPHD